MNLVFVGHTLKNRNRRGAERRRPAFPQGALLPPRRGGPRAGPLPVEQPEADRLPLGSRGRRGVRPEPLAHRPLVDERPDPALDDERRRYYRLTRFGRDVAIAEVRRLESIVSQAHAKKLLRAPLKGGSR